MTASQYGGRPGGHRAHLVGGHMVQLPLVTKKIACFQAPEDLDLLVKPLAALVPGHATHRKILLPRADTHAKQKAITRQDLDSLHLLCHQRGLAYRQFVDEGGEFDGLCHRRHRSYRDEAFNEGNTLEKFPTAVLVIGIAGVRLPGVTDTVRHTDPGVAGRFRGARQRQVMVGVTHAHLVAEFHTLSPGMVTRGSARHAVCATPTRRSPANGRRRHCGGGRSRRHSTSNPCRFIRAPGPSSSAMQPEHCFLTYNSTP